MTIEMTYHREPVQLFAKAIDPVSAILNRRVVFLIGVPRSGTTWLQLMLSSSEQIVSVNETHLFNGYMRSLFTEWTSRQRDTRPIGLHEFIEREEYLGMVRNFACSVMMKILARKPAATIILEKTPKHLKCWNDILSVFPDAYFLHLVRDPRSVVSSLLSANRKWGLAWAHDSVEWCERWSEDVRYAKELEQATERYTQVRYEDLLGTGPETLRSVFFWLGFAVPLEECSRIFTEHGIANLRENRIKGAAWNLAKEPDGFFRLGEPDSWKRDLTPRQAFLIETRCQKLMMELGYTPVSKPKIVWPLVSKSYLKRALKAGLRRLAE
jgi:hypothetical protein